MGLGHSSSSQGMVHEAVGDERRRVFAPGEKPELRCSDRGPSTPAAGPPSRRMTMGRAESGIEVNAVSAMSHSGGPRPLSDVYHTRSILFELKAVFYIRET